MKPILRAILIFSGFLVSAFNHASAQDGSTFYQVEGKIVDSRSASPVVFANIYITGTSIGTVANMDGEFVLKIPRNYKGDSLTISSMGYENLKLGIENFTEADNLVKLSAAPIPLAEATIINRDARNILTSAIEKIRDNYSQKPVMVTSFYRESIRKGRKYVVVSEAILEGYKASYSSIFDLDRVSILKARKSSDFEERDTIILKLQGGPITMFQLDFVKDPGELLDRNVMPYYQYELNGQTMIDDRLAFVIAFNQLPEIDVPFYKGKYYVGVEDLAFLGAEFHLDEDRIGRAREFMVKSEPPGAHIDVDKAHYLVNYRFFDGKWHLSYVRSEVEITVNWERKLFSSSYTTKVEMAVTDVDSAGITRFKKPEMVKSSDIFIDQVSSFEDPDFWGDYNIIRPEESIQSAIERMGRSGRFSSPGETD